MIKKEELLICLDEIDFNRFVSSFASNISSEYFGIIEFLMSNGHDKIQFNRINAFAQFIFFERQSQHFGWDTHFEINKDMDSFQELIYFFNVFIVLTVSFDVWKELVVDALEILKDQIKTGSLNCKRHPKYNEFIRKFNMILDEIIKDPEMEQKYFDFLNGAL